MTEQDQEDLANIDKVVSSLKSICETREEWLNKFTQLARPHFERVEFPLPEKIRASIGFPSTGKRSKRIGECWSSDASQDKTFEIFITPKLDDILKIAGIYVHELCHTATPKAGHGPKFRKCATGLGLEGKMTATTEGPEFYSWAVPIIQQLGALPHASLDSSHGVTKKQTTRLLKAECTECGLVFRITKTWVTQVLDEQDSILRCPCNSCSGVMELS